MPSGTLRPVLLHTAGVPALPPQRPGGVPSRPGSTLGMVGMNGSAAYADIDTGVAVAVTRSRFDTDLPAVSEIDRVVADIGTPHGAR
jgi:hypothetical protein